MAALSCNVLILRVGTQHPVRGNAHRRSPRLSHPVPPAPLKLACHGSWASCGCCGHRGCVRSDVCPSAPPPPPPPDEGNLLLGSPKMDACSGGSSSSPPQWSTGHAREPYPCTVSSSPAWFRLQPLGRDGWYLNRQLGPLFLRGRWEAFQHPSACRFPASTCL